MVKKEVCEIRKMFKDTDVPINRICGCYVDEEKNKKAMFTECFSALPEEEVYKYLEIFKKCFSGKINKNLINLSFPLQEEQNEGRQHKLYLAYDSRLENKDILDEFFDRIIGSYEYTGRYLILMIHGAYDVPGKTSDGATLEDASENVYEYLLCALCPVTLSKSGLSYHDADAAFHERIRDWIVGAPETAFLFPAFNDRATDIHNILCYVKKGELQQRFVEKFLGCTAPDSADQQKEKFKQIIESCLKETCNLDIVKNIQGILNTAVEENLQESPLTINKNELMEFLKEAGATGENLSNYAQIFDQITENSKFIFSAENILDLQELTIKTNILSLKMDPDYTSGVQLRTIDGRKCLVIPAEGDMEVNGIKIKKS